MRRKTRLTWRDWRRKCWKGWRSADLINKNRCRRLTSEPASHSSDVFDDFIISISDNMKNNQEFCINSPNFISLTLYLVFQPRIVSSIFTFFSIFVESYFLSSYFSAVLFYFLPRLCLFYPSTSKLRVLDGQFKRMEVFLSPILNRDMGFSMVLISGYYFLASVLSCILLLRYYSVWFLLLMKSLIE